MWRVRTVSAVGIVIQHDEATLPTTGATRSAFALRGGPLSSGGKPNGPARHPGALRTPADRGVQRDLRRAALRRRAATASGRDLPDRGGGGDHYGPRRLSSADRPPRGDRDLRAAVDAIATLEHVAARRRCLFGLLSRQPGDPSECGSAGLGGPAVRGLSRAPRSSSTWYTTSARACV